MKSLKNFLILTFVLSQLALWLFLRNSNFNLAVDLDELEQQKYSLTFDLERQQKRLAHLTSLGYLVKEAKRLEISEVETFWHLPSSAIASLPMP